MDFHPPSENDQRLVSQVLKGEGWTRCWQNDGSPCQSHCKGQSLSLSNSKSKPRKNESRHRLKEHILHRLLKAVDNTDDFIELFPQELKDDRFCNFLYAQGKEDIEQAIQHEKKQWKKVHHDFSVYSKPLSPHDMDYRPFKKY